MRRKYAIAFVMGLAFCVAGFAQAPSGAPSGATGQCKDGTYTTNATKRGACRGHKGVQTWFEATSAKEASSAKTSKTSKTRETHEAAKSQSSAAAASAPATAAPATAAPARPSSSPSRTTRTSGPPAPGGGPGLVWVNSSTNVYHCYGSQYYGRTKGGKYMTEAQAKGAGAHPDHGKACSK